MPVSKPSELHNLTLPRQHFGKISADDTLVVMQMSDMKSSGYSPPPELLMSTSVTVFCADACNLYSKVRFRFSDYTLCLKTL